MLSSSKKEKQKGKPGQSQSHQILKPLLNKRFYLDIKSHIASKNLEERLKNFGATVEVFLVKEVNCVVTDRPQWSGAPLSGSGSTPKCFAQPSPSLTPLGPCSIESPVALDSPGDGLGGGGGGGRCRTKSRAEAMLERARLQPQQNTVDPLENASRWNIPVWPLEKVHKWLDKISEKLHKYNKTQGSTSKGLISFKAPFIKLESFSRQHRPAYKEFSSWPTISLDVDIAGCPFQSPKKRKSRELNQRQSTKNKNGTAATVNSLDNSRMTRNAHGRLQQAHEDAFAVSGYCEICQINYIDQQQHIQSERHQQFVKNSNNYLALDTLINKGPTMDAFLKLNGANQISPVTLSGSTRRSLRSVVKLVNSTKTAEQVLAKKFTPPSNGHHFTRSSSQRQSEEKSKMLLQHKETLEVQCNGIWSHCYETRHGGLKSPISGNLARRDSWELRTGAGVGRPQRIRRASASYCSTSLPLHQQLSPTGSDSGHHLRSRGQLWLPSNLLGTTAEDEGYPARSRATHVSSEPQPARISRDVPGLRSSEDKVLHVSGSVKNEVRTTGRHGGNHNTLSKDEAKGCTNKSSALGTKDETRHTSGRNSTSNETSMAKEEAKTNKGSGSNTGSKEDCRTSVSKGVREDAKGAVNKNSVSNNTSSAESKYSNHKGSSGKIIRRKRLSVEEKLIEDNKAYYKLELKNSKLRSSGYFPSQREVEFFSKVDIKEETKEEEKTERQISSGGKCNGVQPLNGPKKEKPTDETVVVRRVRKSELTLLSDEAESFMFGEPARRDVSSDSSSDEEEEEEEEEKESKVNRCTKKDSEESTDVRKNVKKNEADTAALIKQEPANKDRGNILQCDESSMGSIDSCSMASSCDTNPSRQKRKRRTHAEAFIHDNLDYYKFEIPGSRLRFQGSLLPQTFTHVEENTSPNRNSKTNCALLPGRKGNKSKLPKKIVTADRSNIKADMQDNHEGKTEEQKTKLKEEDVNDENEMKASDTGGNLLSSMDRLQFSFEAVPQTEPWYQTYLRQDEGHEFYSYACMSDSCYWKSFLLPYELSSSEGSGLGTGNAGSGSSSAVKKKRNKYAHLLDKKPRKSPRCHASTLAILSSLMQYRRRKEPDKLKDDWQKTPSSSSNSAEEEGSTENVSAESSPVASSGSAEQKRVPDTNLHEVARTIDKMLSLIGDSEELSGSDNEISGDDVKQDAREMNSPLKGSECKSPKTQGTNDRKRNSLKHENKKSVASRAKKVEIEVMRHKEMLEIDPVVMEELSSLPPPSAAAERVIRCRGGPKIDVVTLLNGFSTCHCLEEAHSSNKETIVHPTNSHLILGETSCNSSECGASSTCETITFSDYPEGKIGFLRGKKRKRKKNRTGWPIEKQKSKKKLIEKFNKGNRNCSGAAVKPNHVLRKINLSVENNLLTSENSADTYTREIVKDSRASPDASSSKVGEVHNVELKSDQPLSHLRHPTGVPTRTESIESVEHSSLEYQPCVRVTKISNIAEAVVLAGSSSSRNGISNNRRLRSASMSSSSPNSSVSIQKKCFPLSAEGSPPIRKRGRPRKEFSSPSSRWSTWSARKRR